MRYFVPKKRSNREQTFRKTTFVPKNRQNPEQTRGADNSDPWRSGYKSFPAYIRPVLLEPLGEMVLGVEEVYGKAYPACCKYYDCSDDFAYEGDGLLENVDDGNYRKDYADNVNDAHILYIFQFSKNTAFFGKYLYLKKQFYDSNTEDRAWNLACPGQ